MSSFVRYSGIVRVERSVMLPRSKGSCSGPTQGKGRNGKPFNSKRAFKGKGEIGFSLIVPQMHSKEKGEW